MTMTVALSRLTGVVVVALSCVVVRAQQEPFFKTTKFMNVSHRQNVCDRQKLLFENKIELPNALEGLNLSVVLTNYKSPGSTPFFTLVDGKIDEEAPGLFAIIMDELADRAGFFWRNSYGVVDPIDPDVDGNRTWSDLLEWEVDAYDLSAGKWDRSADRMKREISFPEGWYDASTILVESSSGESQQTLNIWSFLLPFQWQVWVLIVVTVIVTGLMYWILEVINVDADERDLEHKPGASVFYSFITMTGHYEFRPQTTAARLLTWSLTFFALIIVSAYTANLVSFLVVRHTPTFKIESIEHAVVLRAPICIQGKVQADEYLSKKYPEAHFLRKNNNREVFTSLLDGECQIATVPISAYDEAKRNSELNGDCTLSWQGRVEQIVPSGFATAIDAGVLCSSLISYVLDYHLIKMKAEGFLERAWENHLSRIGDQDCIEAISGDVSGDNSQDDDTYSLSIKEMAGIFIVHAILVGLALFAALIEHLRARRADNAKTDDPGEPCETDSLRQGEASTDPDGSTDYIGPELVVDEAAPQDGEQRSHQGSYASEHLA